MESTNFQLILPKDGPRQKIKRTQTHQRKQNTPTEPTRKIW